jgi:hypothetical protein
LFHRFKSQTFGVEIWEQWKIATTTLQTKQANDNENKKAIKNINW